MPLIFKDTSATFTRLHCSVAKALHTPQYLVVELPLTSVCAPKRSKVIGQGKKDLQLEKETLTPCYVKHLDKGRLSAQSQQKTNLCSVTGRNNLWATGRALSWKHGSPFNPHRQNAVPGDALKHLSNCAGLALPRW